MASPGGSVGVIRLKPDAEAAGGGAAEEEEELASSPTPAAEVTPEAPRLRGDRSLEAEELPSLLMAWKSAGRP